MFVFASFVQVQRSGNQNETLTRVILCSGDDTNYIVLQSLKHPAIKFNYVSLANLFKNKAAVSLLFIFLKPCSGLKMYTLPLYTQGNTGKWANAFTSGKAHTDGKRRRH